MKVKSFVQDTLNSQTTVLLKHLSTDNRVQSVSDFIRHIVRREMCAFISSSHCLIQCDWTDEADGESLIIIESHAIG